MTNIPGRPSRWLLSLSLALVLAGLGLPPLASSLSVAAEADEDRRTIQGCLDEAGGDDLKAARRLCIGRVAGPCMDAGGGSNAEMAECVARETFVWDALLNTAYPKALAKAREVDEAEGGNLTSAAKALVKAQRAWIAFRDAECERVRASYGSGTMGPIAAEECTRTLTADRAIDLLNDEAR